MLLTAPNLQNIILERGIENNISVFRDAELSFRIVVDDLIKTVPQIRQCRPVALQAHRDCFDVLELLVQGVDATIISRREQVVVLLLLVEVRDVLLDFLILPQHLECRAPSRFIAIFRVKRR